MNLGTNCWQHCDDPLLVFHTQVTVLKLQVSACNITSSSKQNRGCIGIGQHGNKISVLMTVCANVFRFGVAAHRKLCLRYLIQQSSKASRSKAPGSPWRPTRGNKRGCCGFWLHSAQNWYIKHSANIRRWTSASHLTMPE